jgi:hypothetical protein
MCRDVLSLRVREQHGGRDPFAMLVLTNIPSRYARVVSSRPLKITAPGGL